MQKPAVVKTKHAYETAEVFEPPELTAARDKFIELGGESYTRAGDLAVLQIALQEIEALRKEIRRYSAKPVKARR